MISTACSFRRLVSARGRLFVTSGTALVLLLGLSSAAAQETEPQETAPAETEVTDETSAARTGPDLEEDEEEETQAKAPNEAQEKTGVSAAKDPKPNASKPKSAQSNPQKSKSAQSKKQKPKPPQIDYSKLPLGSHQSRIDLGVGISSTWYRDGTFDLFRDKNAQPALRVSAAATLLTWEKWSLAANLSYEHFESSAEARTLPTLLRVGRALLGAEARYHVQPWIFGYGRLQLGPSFRHSTVGEPASDTLLELSRAGFAGAAALGGAMRVAGSRDGRERLPRLHLFVEAGYAFSSALSLTYEIKDDDVLRPEPVDLGRLSLNGALVSGGAMVSF